MELINTDIVVQTVTPGLVRANDSPNDTALSYVLPTTRDFVRNTVDSLGVSQRISGSWIFSVQVGKIVNSRMLSDRFTHDLFPYFLS